MANESTGLRAKILSSAKLSTLKFASEIGLRLVSTVVLTRLLAPEVYGVFAIVLVYLYLLEMFSDFGIRSLILTKEDEVDDDFLRTCWTVSIIRGLLIAIVSALIALVIGLLQTQGVFGSENPYAASSLPWAIVALGGAAFIMGFETPMRFMSERAMAFGLVTAVDVARNVVALVVTIALAFYLRSIWALVLGNVARSLFHVAASFAVFHGPKMRLSFRRDYLGLLIDRGKWIMGHSAQTALSQSADRLVLGFVMSSSSFGFYFIARQLVDIVPQFLNTLNGQMALQVFTQLHKTGAAEFRRNYYRYRLFIDVMAGVSTGGLIVVAPLLVDVIFDDRYAEVANIIQIIALAILVSGPLVLRDAFSAQRQFKAMTFLGAVSIATLWIGLAVAIAVFDSVFGALLVIALHRLPETIVLLYMGYKRDWVVLWRESLVLIFCVIGALLGWGVILLWDLLT